MNRLLKKGFLAFFLSVYLRADDLVTYTIIKEEDLRIPAVFSKEVFKGQGPFSMFC
ncbi:hypothetical protein VN0405_14680 [Helicobacter pylori]|nr:hypothetical protein VN0405_14680 [Helicobacter pylori]